jgi:hypothetical protein
MRRGIAKDETLISTGVLRHKWPVNTVDTRVTSLKTSRSLVASLNLPPEEAAKPLPPHAHDTFYFTVKRRTSLSVVPPLASSASTFQKYTLPDLSLPTR